jgi:hypothetical protein
MFQEILIFTRSSTELDEGSSPRSFDKRLKDTKELFEKWKAVTDSNQENTTNDQLRVYTRGGALRCVFTDRPSSTAERHGKPDIGVDAMHGHHRKEP